MAHSSSERPYGMVPLFAVFDLGAETGGLMKSAVDMTYQASTGTSVTFPKLTLKITSVTGAQAATTVLTSEDTSAPVGSSVTLELQHPGITAKRTSGDVSKWCNPPNRAAGECGA